MLCANMMVVRSEGGGAGTRFKDGTRRHRAARGSDERPDDASNATKAKRSNSIERISITDFSDVRLFTMGRRAKNKQGPPAPLEDDSHSTKKLGKRKAPADGDIESPKSAKKVKNADGKGKSKPVQAGKENARKKGKKSKAKAADSDDDAGSGWEDVEDDDIKAKAK